MPKKGKGKKAKKSSGEQKAKAGDEEAAGGPSVPAGKEPGVAAAPKVIEPPRRELFYPEKAYVPNQSQREVALDAEQDALEEYEGGKWDDALEKYAVILLCISRFDHLMFAVWCCTDILRPRKPGLTTTSPI